MPILSVADWNTDPALNLDLNSVSLAEGVTKVPDFNNLIRILMSQAAQYVGPGFLFGLTPSNNGSDASNDMDFAVGQAMDSTSRFLLKLTSGLTKRLDAVWAAGSGNGGRFTAAIADATYYPYLIANPTTGVVDIGYSGNASDPTGGTAYPAGFTLYRRIHSFVRSAGAILPCVWDGDRVMLKSSIATQASGLTTAAVLYLSSVPVGIRVRAHIAVKLSSSTLSTSFYGLVTDPSLTDTVPSILNSNLALRTPATAGTYIESSALDCMTDTSGQVRARVSNGDANCTLTLTTFGWTDTRGRI